MTRQNLLKKSKADRQHLHSDNGREADSQPPSLTVAEPVDENLLNRGDGLNDPTLSRDSRGLPSSLVISTQ
jgi:hypothetical protein